MKAIQVSILKRALGDKGFEDVYQQYCEARYSKRNSQPPTDKQIRLAELAKKVGPSKAARQVGAARSVVDYAISRVARYNYLTN